MVGYQADPGLEVTASAAGIRLVGQGADIWGDHDEFFYLYTQMPSEGIVEVTLRDLDAPHDWSKAGIMIRESLAPDARNALLYVSGAGRALIQARTETGADTTSQGDTPGVGVGTTLKLTRFGNEVIGEYRDARGAWQEVGRYSIRFSGNALVGLALTSHEAGRTATADFSGLRLLQGAPGGQEPPAAQPPTTAPRPVPVPPATGSSTGLASSWVCGSQPLEPRYHPTLYVATTGNDNNDGRSEARPLRTLQRAANLARAGDVVWVRGGVYSANVSFQGSGTSSQPIVFESYPGECAVLDGSGHERYQHVRFEQARYYVFRNFEVRNSPAQGVHLINSSDIVVSHVRSHHNGLSGMQNVGGSRNTFTHFIVHDNSDGRQGNADGIGISSGTGMLIDTCVAFRNSDDGVDAWKSYGTVIERCVSFDNGFQGGDGNGFKAGGGLSNGNAVLRFNVAFGNKSQGFNYNSGGGITFEHNTSYDNDYYGFIAANATLRNNLSYANARRAWQDDGGNSQSGNSWNINLNEAGFVSTDRRSPDFLALSSASGARNRATGSTGSSDLGALPYGQTLSSWLSVDVHALLNY